MTELTLPLVGQPGAPVDVRFGGDVDQATGRLLSVAELQLALRAARSGQLTAAGRTPAPAAALHVPSGPGPSAARPAAGEAVAVVSAHGGAGASTTALAIATAAATGGRTVQVIEWCPPQRSGLVAAATSELGPVDGGYWRRGGRGAAVVIDRRGELEPVEWPTPPNPGCLRLADLGLTDSAQDLPVVLVCRATVPGIRLAEHALSRLHAPLALAAVGPSRWPGQVTASAGGHVRQLREQGRLVAVPIDRRLDVEGLTSDPLPKQVIEAGAHLVALLDAARGGTPASAHSAPRNHKKGTPR